jgi:hypothetical protein
LLHIDLGFHMALGTSLDRLGSMNDSFALRIVEDSFNRKAVKSILQLAFSADCFANEDGTRLH